MYLPLQMCDMDKKLPMVESGVRKHLDNESKMGDPKRCPGIGRWWNQPSGPVPCPQMCPCHPSRYICRWRFSLILVSWKPSIFCWWYLSCTRWIFAWLTWDLDHPNSNLHWHKLGWFTTGCHKISHFFLCLKCVTFDLLPKTSWVGSSKNFH